MKKNHIIPYRADLKARARELRKNSTLAEILVWSEIRERRIFSYQFHRQVPMLEYIVDFYCHELQLAIEIDGDSHDYNFDYDLKRQSKIEEQGVSFLRFDDREVKNDLQNVIRTIEHWIGENRKISPDKNIS